MNGGGYPEDSIVREGYSGAAKRTRREMCVVEILVMCGNMTMVSFFR